MSDYPRSDAIRAHRRQLEAQRRLRTRRPLKHHVASPTWQWFGLVTNDSYFLPKKIADDPLGDGDYPEWKAIFFVDGWLSVGGPVVINWRWNDGYFYEGHEISGGSNPIEIDPPFVIENDDVHGQWIQPEIVDVPDFPSYHLAASASVRIRAR